MASLLNKLPTAMENMTDVTSSVSQLSEAGQNCFLMLNPCSTSICSDMVLKWHNDLHISTFFGLFFTVASKFVLNGKVPTRCKCFTRDCSRQKSTYNHDTYNWLTSLSCSQMRGMGLLSSGLGIFSAATNKSANMFKQCQLLKLNVFPVWNLRMKIALTQKYTKEKPYRIYSYLSTTWKCGFSISADWDRPRNVSGQW